MGIPGVPLNISKDSIKEALKKSKGVMSRAYKMLDCSHYYLYKRVRGDEELNELLKELRAEYEQTLLDEAENTLLFAISRRDTDLGSALKSSFYVLNNKGRERGYVSRYNAEVVTDDDQVRPIIQFIQRSNKEASGTNSACGSTVADEQPILDKGCRGESCKVPDELGAEGVI